MKRAGRSLALVALVLAGTPGALRAWGSATHQWITARALEQVAEDPAVAPLARDPHLRAALLGGAVAPDMMLALAPVPIDRDARNLAQRGHLVFKDRRVAELLIASARTGEEWASGLGFLCHYLQDEVGDHKQGYPTRKTSAWPQSGLLNEVLLDLLVLLEPDAPIEPIAVDPESLAAAARQLDYSLEVADLRRARRAFAWARAALRGFLRGLADARQGPFLDSLGAHYADALGGIEGQPGLAELVRRTAAAIRHYARTRPAWISHLRHSRRPLQEPHPPLVEDMVRELVAMAGPVLRLLDLPGHAPELLSWRPLRAAPVIFHLLHVWLLDTTDFPAAATRSTALRKRGLEVFRERRRAARRRKRAAARRRKTGS